MLRAALESLTRLRTQPEFDYEVLVVDDGSTDETARVVQSVMDTSVVDIRYLRQENRGIAGARNTGVFHARGSWVAFFDDDQLAEPDWLVHLLAAASSSGADCVGGPALLSAAPPIWSHLVSDHQAPARRKPSDARATSRRGAGASMCGAGKTRSRVPGMHWSEETCSTVLVAFRMSSDTVRIFSSSAELRSVGRVLPAHPMPSYTM